MTDEQERPDKMEPLGPAYEALQRRLLDDGARWRAGLPSTERLEQRLHALKNQERAAHFRAAGVKRSGGLRVIHRIKGGYNVFHGRVKAALGGIALAAVVGLFAVLFYGFAGHRAGTAANPGGARTASPTWIVTSFPTSPQYNSYAPMVAPSNPSVVYKLAPADGAADQTVLARSTDGGATWRTFALPSVNGGNAVPVVVFVSPLNPQDVFLTVRVELPFTTPGFQPCPQSVTVGGLSSYAALSGGPSLCAVEFVSKDGGEHWSQAHLPASAAPAALGDSSGYIFLDSVLFSNGATVFQVQGNRLYSATNVEPGASPNAPEAQSTGTIRIVVSTDGGLNWSYADKALASRGQSICDYTAAPTGSTLFAVTSAGCNSEIASPPFLWRSDDAGAHWTEVGKLPGDVEMGMIAVSRGNGQMPLLYVNTAQETCTVSPYLSRPKAGGCSIDTSPANLRVSADGGKTWRAAPTKGFPTTQPGDRLQNPGAPLGALGDGSVLFLARSAQGFDSFYTWKSGDASWHQVGPGFNNVSSAFVVPGTRNTVCVVTGYQSDYTVHTFTI
ncbi:MAG TPA: sialidase family protein [Ktedonobacterales bacterium]|jgi:hypothetical protein